MPGYTKLPFTGKNVCNYKNAYIIYSIVKLSSTQATSEFPSLIDPILGGAQNGFVLYGCVVLNKSACPDYINDKLNVYLDPDEVSDSHVYIPFISKKCYLITYGKNKPSDPDSNIIIYNFNDPNNSTLDYKTCKISMDFETLTPMIKLPFDQFSFYFNEMIGSNIYYVDNNTNKIKSRPLSEEVNNLALLYGILDNFYHNPSCNKLYSFINKVPYDCGTEVEIFGPKFDSALLIQDCPCFGEKCFRIESQKYYLTYPCQDVPIYYSVTDIPNSGFNIVQNLNQYLNECPKCYNCLTITNQPDCSHIYSNVINADVRICGIKQICRNVRKMQLEVTIKRPKKVVCPFMNVQSIDGCIKVESKWNNNGEKKIIAQGEISNCVVDFYRCSPSYSSEKRLYHSTPSNYQVNNLLNDKKGLRSKNYYNLNEILTKFINKIDCEEQLVLYVSIPMTLVYPPCSCVPNLCDILDPSKFTLSPLLRIRLNTWDQPNVITSSIILDKDPTNANC